MSCSIKTNDIIILQSDDEEDSENNLVPNNTPKNENSPSIKEGTSFNFYYNQKYYDNIQRKEMILSSSSKDELGEKTTNISSIIWALAKDSSASKEKGKTGEK